MFILFVACSMWSSSNPTGRVIRPFRLTDFVVCYLSSNNLCGPRRVTSIYQQFIFALGMQNHHAGDAQC